MVQPLHFHFYSAGPVYSITTDEFVDESQTSVDESQMSVDEYRRV